MRSSADFASGKAQITANHPQPRGHVLELPKAKDAEQGVGCDGIKRESTWTSSAKSGVGTAVDAQSRVWFTLSHGIVNEVYFPRLDQANTRDLGLIVTDRRT